MDNVEIKNTDNLKLTVDSRPASVVNDTGIMGTATHRQGAPRNTVNEDWLVTVKGGEMTVGQAVSMGLLSKNPDGSFSEPPETNDAPRDTNPYEQALEGAVAMEVDSAFADSMTDFVTSLDNFGASVPSVIAQMLKNPNQLPEAVAQLAAASDMDIGSAARHVSSLAVGLETAIGEFVVEQGGVPPDHLEKFEKYVYSQYGMDKIVSAINNSLRLGDARPFLEMSKSYLKAAGITPGVDKRFIDYAKKTAVR
jgi:hypothetical protein